MQLTLIQTSNFQPANIYTESYKWSWVFLLCGSNVNFIFSLMISYFVTLTCFSLLNHRVGYTATLCVGDYSVLANFNKVSGFCHALTPLFSCICYFQLILWSWQLVFNEMNWEFYFKSVCFICLSWVPPYVRKLY